MTDKRLPEDRLRGPDDTTITEVLERDVERAEEEARQRQLARPGTFHTDGLQVTPDEALELFAHHMTLAHLLFQNMPEGPEAREELRRLTSRSVLGDRDPACVGALAAWDALTAHYAEKDDGDDE